jgi:hypothetical protein
MHFTTTVRTQSKCVVRWQCVCTNKISPFNTTLCFCVAHRFLLPLDCACTQRQCVYVYVDHRLRCMRTMRYRTHKPTHRTPVLALADRPSVVLCRRHRRSRQPVRRHYSMQCSTRPPHSSQRMPVDTNALSRRQTLPTRRGRTVSCWVIILLL